MKRFTTALLIISLMALAFTGCAPKKEATTEPEAPVAEAPETEASQKITVILDWTPNTNHTGLYVAQDLGYYTEEGLEVEIIQPSEGGAADLVAAGQGQFGISYQEEITYARTAEVPLPIKAVATIIQHNTSGFASPKEAGIVSPKDFEGKQYGGWGSPMEIATLKALMASEGADFDKLEMVDVGALDFFAATQTDIDFTWIFYGWDGIAAEQKDYPINFIKLQDFDPALDYYTPVIMTSDQIIADDPALVEKFLRATEKGYLHAIESPESAVESLLKAAPEIDATLAVNSQKYLADQYVADAAQWGIMKESVWVDYAAWMHERDLLEKALNTEEAYTNEFLPKK